MTSTQFHVSFIKEGIIRISKYQSMPQRYLEKYGIVTITKSTDKSPIKVEDTNIILPDGRVISFDVRPEKDDELWQNEYEYFCNKFAEKIPKKIYIEGRPNIEAIDIREMARQNSASWHVIAKLDNLSV